MISRQFKYRQNYSTYKKPLSVRRLERRAKNKLVLTILIGAVLLYLTIAWGLPALIQGLSFLNTGRQTKSPVVAVQNPTLAPPVLNIPYEATNTASITIKGYAAPSTQVEIYVDEDLKTTVTTEEDGSFEAKDVSLSLGNNNISGKTVDAQGGKSLSSKAIRIVFDNSKPKLDVTSPSDGQTITGGDKKVKVEGTTDPLDTDSLTANGIRLVVSADGHFSQNINLNEGENDIVIIATDEAQNSSVVTRKVIYQPQ